MCADLQICEFLGRIKLDLIWQYFLQVWSYVEILLEMKLVDESKIFRKCTSKIN